MTERGEKGTLQAGTANDAKNQAKRKIEIYNVGMGNKFEFGIGDFHESFFEESEKRHVVSADWGQIRVTCSREQLEDF